MLEGRDYPEILQLARIASKRHCAPPPEEAEVDRRAAEWAAECWVEMLRRWGQR